MNRSEHIRALLEEYNQQRMRVDSELNARIREAERLDPEIARLRAENVSLALGTMRTILSLPTKEERTAAAENMKARGIANNAELRKRLRANHLPENSFEPQWRCPVCRDTAYVGDAPARFCECFENRLRERIYEDGSVAGVAEQSFRTFDPERIPAEDGQRERSVKARGFCERYAELYPAVKRPTLLLAGTAGLGKTFLLNCIYTRVTERGLSAIRVTAFRLFETMRARHFGAEDGADGFRELIDAPLLLIDDLGTEPMMKNITVEYLFLLLNERTNARRGTVIATNLTAAQLQERYGERVSSRLLDTTMTSSLLLTGKSLRG